MQNARLFPYFGEGAFFLLEGLFKFQRAEELR